MFFQCQLAAQVLQRVGEVAIDARHIAAEHGRSHPHRPALTLPHQAKVGVDMAPRFEDIPELVELGRRVFAETLLVQLQVQQVEAKVERGRRAE